LSGLLRMICVLGVAAVAALTMGPTSAKAGLLSCGTSAERPFAAWGDMSPYTIAPNGDLSAGALGWSLTGGARIVGENNSLRSGRNSVSLPSGASATSPAACVKLADPASRFFLRNTSGGSGRVRVDIQYKSVLGLLTMTTNLGYTSAGTTWQPSEKYGHVLANILGTLALNPKLSANLRFKFTALGGSFMVDDLFVDPLIQI
jgi:hypothetical protein